MKNTRILLLVMCLMVNAVSAMDGSGGRRHVAPQRMDAGLAHDDDQEGDESSRCHVRPERSASTEQAAEAEAPPAQRARREDCPAAVWQALQGIVTPSVTLLAMPTLVRDNIMPEERAHIQGNQRAHIPPQGGFLQGAAQRFLLAVGETFRLPPLTDTQMAAGVQNDQFYSATELEFARLHDIGTIIDSHMLQDLFFKTMFQYYTYEALGFDMSYHYAMVWQDGPGFRLSRYDLQKFSALAERFGLPAPTTVADIERYLSEPIQVTSNAIDALKQNRLLQAIAAAYMRQKVVTEKLADLTEATGRQDLQGILLEHDRYAIHLQTMIYHFMQEAYGQYKGRIRVAGTHEEKIHVGRLLATGIPHFVDFPYYARLMAELERLAQPVNLR